MCSTSRSNRKPGTVYLFVLLLSMMRQEISKLSPEFLSRSKSVGSTLVILLNVLSSFKPVYAQGDTGPLGMEGIDELLLHLTIYPLVGVGFSFLLFKATGKAWFFFLAPFFYWWLSTIAPFDPTFPAGLAGAWLYLTHILAFAIIYPIFIKTEKVWPFFFAPFIGWAIQLLCFLIVTHLIGEFGQ